MAIDINQIRANMKLPPQLQVPMQKVVLAGMKVMFDPKTHQLMLDELNRPAPLDQNLADGIVGLMVILFKQSNQTMPPQVVIPAGIDLLMQAVDFIEKSGIKQIDNAIIGSATTKFIQGILAKFGLDPNKVFSNIQQAGASMPQQGA